jgi:uncharacterized protein (DUF2141 family)
MKLNRIARIGFRAACLVSLALSSRADAQEAPESKGQTLVVNVGTFRDTEGILGCRLYSSPAGFPESSVGTVERRVRIRGSTATCTFENVSPGVHAVSVMHDANDNRKLDKNFLGIPTEGYGVSNNHTHAMSPPSWEESRFTVEPGKNLGIAIALRY